MPAPSRRVALVDFHRTKYGPEILIDTAWVHEIPTFLHPLPHALSFYDIFLVTAGRGWFWLDAHRYAVRPGAVLFTSPGQVRRWQVRDLDGICLFFPALFLEEFFRDALFLHRLPFFHVPDGAGSLQLAPAAARSLRRKLLAMRNELRALRADSVHLLRARLYEALITIAREYSPAHVATPPRNPHPVVLRYREMVESEAPQQHHVSHYARQLALTPGHLNALCRRHLGRTAKAIIEDRLSVEARRSLLYSNHSIEQIGYDLGFKDPSYFARFFRRTSGKTPSVFRTESRAGA
jgi:AraC family transcriptional activator of pobA